MAGNYEYTYQKKMIGLTAQEAIHEDGTDIQIASGMQTPAAAGEITLFTIAVPYATYCLIGDISFGAGASSVLTVSYTLNNSTVSKYVYLAAAGFTELAHDFSERPYMAVLNTSSSKSALSITGTVDAAASTMYLANASYAIREIRQ